MATHVEDEADRPEALSTQNTDIPTGTTDQESPPSTQASFTLARKTTNRRRVSKEAPLKAGKANDATSFINKDNPEATIAAYCGCDDVGIFRRFYTSALVLPYYVKSLKYRGYGRRTVLSLLGDLPYDQYWASDEDPEEVYPLTDAEKRGSNFNYGMGLIL